MWSRVANHGWGPINGGVDRHMPQLAGPPVTRIDVKRIYLVTLGYEHTVRAHAVIAVAGRVERCPSRSGPSARVWAMPGE